MLRLLLILAFLVASSPALAQEPIVGVASVIDGDTIEIYGQRIRLYGIDAPESRQLCSVNGQSYRCGQKAALALADLIGRKSVACERRDRDRYGRIVAICAAAGVDLAAWLVSEGHALAYRKYSLDYVDEEASAERARAGLWAGDFDPPWEWRRR